ncbi:uncharacterized protein LOC114531410 [Dendronephthya gigantea]|uniref:uncharacterized protein LOC114531410 n=1 Tax=Dendronephthya gigantea TaxID=151771 RepID=UPI00106D1568|nr:uncharacterized protein LOC114531410 [Dendronephthya gigantea]
MPYKCAVAQCKHKSWINKTLKFYSFPKNDTLRQKWIKNIALTGQGYEWSKGDRVCSAHFVGGRKLGNNNVPSIFPRWDKELGSLVWPVDISALLYENKPPPVCPKRLNTAAYEIDLSQEISSSAATMSAESDSVNAAIETANVERLEKGSADVEKEELKSSVERFGAKRFMYSDSDIRFFTGLPDYNTFLAIYNFVKPKPGFVLNYYNGYSNKAKDPSYVNARGRQRTLEDIDELFLTLNRLKLGLLGQDLAERFGLKQNVVSQIVCTWIDRLDYCLCQLNLTTSHQNMEKHLPSCFKGEYKDTYLIIDCTEIFIEKPSQVIQQSATWSEYKSHNTGKGLIGISPTLLPVFACDIYPGSISDEEIVKQSGILKLAHHGDRWLKGIIPIRYEHLSSKMWKVCCRLTAFLPPLVCNEQFQREE